MKQMICHDKKRKAAGRGQMPAAGNLWFGRNLTGNDLTVPAQLCSQRPNWDFMLHEIRSGSQERCFPIGKTSSSC